VPLTHFDRERAQTVLYGVLNATRRPGSPRFTDDDLEYLTRFAGQLSIAVANSVAFAAERERSEQLALVNGVLRESAALLSRERILERAVARIHDAFRPCLVAMLVPEGELFKVAAAASSASHEEGWAGMPLAEGPHGRALRERATVVASEGEPAFAPLSPGARSALAVPILVADEVGAVLYVEGDRPLSVDRGQVITLQTLADGIAILLRNAELYATLEHTNARLVELDRTKSELLNVVAHDFRAPLAAILGWAELLSGTEPKPPGEWRERAQAIVTAASRMAALMDRTLETTRLETGQFAFEFRLVDLAARIRQAAAEFRSDPEHPLVLELPDEPLPAWADGERIAEVVENLLQNAVKYSPNGGEVRLAVKREREVALVSVTDRGIGIAAEDFGKLFRPFSRLRDRSVSGIEGFGLGLSICERFVRAHGGRFAVKSRPGVGSTFSFTLPLFGASAQARAPVLVLASSDAATRRDVRRTAEPLGFAVHEVQDGLEAVEAAARLRPAALVLERILPRLRADEVAERLAAHAGTRTVPILLLGAAGDAAGRFRECLPHPLDRGLLQAALERLGAPVH
jgi:signal transduction histidine kinase